MRTGATRPKKPKPTAIIVETDSLATWLVQLLSVCRPRKPIKPSEWQELHRFAPPHSPRPGKWHNDPFQIEPLDAILDENCNTLVLMWASQFLGKSSIIEGILGWQADQAPSTVVSVFPTVDAAQIWSKNRFTPFIESVGTLARLFKKQKTGDTASTFLHKHYPGGWWKGGGSNSPAQLASHTARITTFDEVDKYVESVGARNHEEGDPIIQVKQRSARYRNPFSILTSTPTVKHFSRIEKEYATTDQRKWHVGCPKCKHSFVILFSDIKWDKIENPNGTKTHLTDTAYLECPRCQAKLTEEQRQKMVQKGKWVATNAKVRNRRGYWANGFLVLGPWPNGLNSWMHYFAERWLVEGKTGTQGKREYQNLVLAETFELETIAPTAPEELFERRETYQEFEGEIVVPERVLLLTAGVDVQRDRVEIEICGWGVGNETWGIQYSVIYGNPQVFEFWDKVDALLLKKWRHPSGHLVWPYCVMIDSGDKPHVVYNFVRSRVPRKIFAAKGTRGFVNPWVIRSQKRDQRLFILKVDTPKESIYSSLRLTNYGPGYCHWPTNPGAGYDLQYFVQLTNERLVLGGAQPYFEPKFSNARNEALDIRVLNYAAKELSFPDNRPDDWTKAQKWLADNPLNDWRPGPANQPAPIVPEPPISLKPIKDRIYPKPPVKTPVRSLKNWLDS